MNEYILVGGTFLCILPGVVTGMLAERKGYTISAWFLTGGLVLLSAIVLGFLPNATHETDASKRATLVRRGNRIGAFLSLVTIVLGLHAFLVGYTGNGGRSFSQRQLQEISALLVYGTTAAACWRTTREARDQAWPFTAALLFLSADPAVSLVFRYIVRPLRLLSRDSLTLWDASVSLMLQIAAMVCFATGMMRLFGDRAPDQQHVDSD